ncbi:P-loop containing nucleoside triphosphate hydrolase protein, partial [Lentinula edodes]
MQTSGQQLPAVDEISCRPPIHGRPGRLHVNIDNFLQKFTPALNTEQERAFRLIASHTQQDNPEPLRMFLGGPGGTGKSHVISALKVFFEEQAEIRRFRLASYTGVAANNISGMTLHSALMLSSASSNKMNSKSHQDLVALWQGVDYLFVDEVSMLGCRFMLKISRALC